MSMRDFMQDLMRAQNASEVRIVHDASVASIPDEDPLIGNHHPFSDDSTEATDNDYAIHRRSVCSLSSEPGGATDILLVAGLLEDVLDAPTAHSTRSVPCGYYGSLAGFRERHRKLKETLSPVKVYRWSPTKDYSRESSITQVTPSMSEPSTPRPSQRRDNLRSRLTRLASDSRIAPGLSDAI